MLIAGVLGIPKLESHAGKVTLALVVTVYCVSSLVLAFTIKCPNCRERWWWDAIISMDSNKLTNLNTQESCPLCGYGSEPVT